MYLFVCICGYRLYFSEGQIIFWALGVSSMDVGREGEASNLQSPTPYCLPSPRAQAPAAARSCSQGCLLYPSAVCMEQVPSWESDCWGRARVQVCSWPWTRSTAPAFEAMYCSSQPAPVGSVVGPACEVMELYMGFVTKRG